MYILAPASESFTRLSKISLLSTPIYCLCNSGSITFTSYKNVSTYGRIASNFSYGTYPHVSIVSDTSSFFKAFAIAST